MTTTYFQIGFFGLLGIFSRFAIDQWAGKFVSAFPAGILSINILGSFLAGVIFVLGNEKGALSTSLTIGMLVGFCGGFTTFSAYSLQSLQFFEKAELAKGLGYFLISPALGLVGAYVGSFLARMLF